MKKLLFSAMVLSFVCLPLFVLADFIPENTHVIAYKVFLVNIKTFPDYEFIGMIMNWYGGGQAINTPPYIIKEGVSLHGGFDNNPLDIYAIKRGELKDQSVDKLTVDWLLKHQAIKLTRSIQLSNYLSKSDPTASQEVYYAVGTAKDNKPMLYKFKQITHYNNGQPDKVEYFQNSQPVPRPIVTSTRRNIFQKILCFFSPLFGKSCPL